MTFLESAATSIQNTQKFLYNNASTIILTTCLIVGYIALTQVYSSILATQVLVTSYQFTLNYIALPQQSSSEVNAKTPKLLKNNVSVGMLSILLTLLAPMYNALRYIRFIVMVVYATILAQKEHEKTTYAEQEAYKFPIWGWFNFNTMEWKTITLGGILDTINNTFPVMKIMNVIDAIALTLAAMSLISVVNLVSSAFYSLILSQFFVNVLLLTILPAIILGPKYVRPVIMNIIAFCTSCMTYIRSLFKKPSAVNNDSSERQTLILANAPVDNATVDNGSNTTPSLTSVVSSDLIIITHNILSAPFSNKSNSSESQIVSDAENSNNTTVTSTN